MRSPRLAIALAALTPLVSACSISDAVDDAAAASSSGPADGLPATCNPLRTAGTCLLPFPSAVYEQDDPSTRTGHRLALVAETLPVSAESRRPLDVARYDAADGFSPATPIVLQFPERIDPASLNPSDAIERSVSPSSATVIVDMTDGSLVAHFSEVDELARREEDRQALLIHPAKRLAPKHRYAVAITDAIRKKEGELPTAPPGFAAIAGGAAPSDAMSQKAAARMPAVLAALESAGVHREHLLVAWDFDTGSDEYLTSHVLSMREQALGVVGESGLGYTITSIDDNDGDPDTLRRIRGTFTVPQFLSQTDPTVPEATIELDEKGAPKLKGQYEAPFVVLIPKAAATATAPLPVVYYGHGLFGSATDEISGPYVPSFANREGYVVFGTDWTGLSKWENPLNGNGSSAAALAVSDFDHLPWITDRLQQALVNAMTLVRTMRGRIVHDPALTSTGDASGTPVADASTVTYYGISLGGIMGGSFLGYDPDVTRGALNVGAGEWSLLFQRSVDWLQFKLVIGGTYPDILDQQILLALAQSQFDFSDPITTAPHAVADPLPGTPKKQVLMQIGVGDCQVSNVASEVVARSMGVPLLADSPLAVWGMPPTAGPLASALTIWDPKLTPLPPITNATPIQDNEVHEAVRRIGKAEDQIQRFFATGEIVSTCDGPCDPE